MELKKLGVTVDCEHCQWASSDECGGFDVTVPVSDSGSGVTGTARLHCVVSPGSHDVQLQQWNDAPAESVELPEKVRQRLTDALDQVADRRVCGSRHLCPSEVIRIVEETENQAP